MANIWSLIIDQFLQMWKFSFYICICGFEYVILGFRGLYWALYNIFWTKGSIKKVILKQGNLYRSILVDSGTCHDGLYIFWFFDPFKTHKISQSIIITMILTYSWIHDPWVWILSTLMIPNSIKKLAHITIQLFILHLLVPRKANKQTSVTV